MQTTQPSIPLQSRHQFWVPWSKGPPKWIAGRQILPPVSSNPEGTLELLSCKARGWRVMALELLSAHPKGTGKAASLESNRVCVDAFQIAGRLRLCWGVSSGCHTSTINISRKDEASCQTSCSKESSKMSTLPSSHDLVSLAHLILQPSLGITNPRCIRSLQFVGPVCGHTWVPGCMMEYLICPLLHPVVSENFSSKVQVLGAPLQAFSFFLPCCHSVNWLQSPFSRRFSSSGRNRPLALSITMRPSSRINFQFLSKDFTSSV